MTIIDSKNISSLNGLNNCVINVTNNFIITSNSSFGENVTLNFIGGQLSVNSSVRLSGNHTTIIAPCYQIFDTSRGDIMLSGTWEIPGPSYPEWWGVKTYDSIPSKNDTSYSSLYDASYAIGKAIELKGSGDVLLSAGIYVLKSRINIPPGINLIGTPGKLLRGNGNKCNFTMLFLHSTFNAATGSKYLIGVNVTQSNGVVSWPAQQEYSIPFSTIKNIEIRNEAHLNVSEREKIPVAIYIGVGIKIENIAFVNFPCAVKSLKESNEYIDSKQIINCYYSYNGLFKDFKTVDDYAFDLHGLGNALLFMHNHIVECKNALRINNCGGGVVSDNIINGDIHIENSKAVAVSSNHMEYGAQIRIYNAVATIADNFIEKRKAVSFIIRGHADGKSSYAHLRNNAIVSRSAGNRNMFPGSGTVSSTEIQKIIAEMTEMCDYDVLVSNNSNVKLQNTLRYWLAETGNANVFPSGIYVKKTNVEVPADETPMPTDTLIDFPEFNKYSYFLSLNCLISAGKVVNRNFVFNDINSMVNISFVTELSEHAYWLADSGVYQYDCQIIWDEDLKLLSPFSAGNYVINSETNNPLIKGQRKGVHLCNVPNSISISKLRFVRKRIGSSNIDYKYVDIPVCGVQPLYDNGLDVNGYRWHSIIKSNIIKDPATDFSTIQFLGDEILTTT